MLMIRVLGKGLIPRGYGIAPRKDPFKADLTLIMTIMNTPGLKVEFINPDTMRPSPLTRDNVQKVYKRYEGRAKEIKKSDIAPPAEVPPVTPPVTPPVITPPSTPPVVTPPVTPDPVVPPVTPPVNDQVKTDEGKTEDSKETPVGTGENKEFTMTPVTKDDDKKDEQKDREKQPWKAKNR